MYSNRVSITPVNVMNINLQSGWCIISEKSGHWGGILVVRLKVKLGDRRF